MVRRRRNHAGWSSFDEKAAIFGGNAARIYLASRGRKVEAN
jgi:hypothetical protein